MVSVDNELVGLNVGVLTVQGLDTSNTKTKRSWLCKCQCGKVISVDTYRLKAGKITSCGCLAKLKAKENATTHGLRHHPLHGRWMMMRGRCNNPNNADYHNYGGLGVGVDPRWDDFGLFVQDMGEPEPGQVLLRRDANADFGPDNCYWGDRKGNKQTNVRQGEDLMDKTFGEVTVFKKADPLPATRGNRWWVRCSCGNEKIVSAKSLKAGDTRSCGCLSKRNLIGDTFSELTVLREDPIKQGKKRRWICQCSCGNTTSVATNDLTSGHTKSCGCGKGLSARERFTTHGMRDHPLYGRWLAMRNRCNNPNDEYYANYGEKGVKVCERWDHFPNFLEDMGMPPEGYTLDRKDNDGDYSPENCRWADNRTQSMNKSTTAMVEYKGEIVKRRELAEKHGIAPDLLRQRLEKGWGIEKALNTKAPPQLKWRVIACLNVLTKTIVFSKKLSIFAKEYDLNLNILRNNALRGSMINDEWVVKRIEDPTPWNDYRGCTDISEDVILKQPNEPHVIFSNVREAYRYLTEHSLLEKEYTLEVFG